MRKPNAGPASLRSTITSVTTAPAPSNARPRGRHPPTSSRSPPQRPSAAHRRPPAPFLTPPAPVRTGERRAPPVTPPPSQIRSPADNPLLKGRRRQAHADRLVHRRCHHRTRRRRCPPDGLHLPRYGTQNSLGALSARRPHDHRGASSRCGRRVRCGNRGGRGPGSGSAPLLPSAYGGRAGVRPSSHSWSARRTGILTIADTSPIRRPMVPPGQRHRRKSRDKTTLSRRGHGAGVKPAGQERRYPRRPDCAAPFVAQSVGHHPDQQSTSPRRHAPWPAPAIPARQKPAPTRRDQDRKLPQNGSLRPQVEAPLPRPSARYCCSPIPLKMEPLLPQSSGCPVEGPKGRATSR